MAAVQVRQMRAPVVVAAMSIPPLRLLTTRQAVCSIAAIILAMPRLLQVIRRSLLRMAALRSVMPAMASRALPIMLSHCPANRLSQRFSLPFMHSLHLYLLPQMLIAALLPASLSITCCRVWSITGIATANVLICCYTTKPLSILCSSMMQPFMSKVSARWRQVKTWWRPTNIRVHLRPSQFRLA